MIQLRLPCVILLFFIGHWFFLNEGTAATSVARKPPEQLRQNEDYRFLKDPKQRTDLWDPLKYIPLNENGSHYLTLGADIRERYEVYSRLNWGQDLDRADGYFLHRLMTHGDLHLGGSFRIFTQLKNGFVSGMTEDPGTSDLDHFDLHQAFFDGKLSLGLDRSLTFRVGRQEYSFGSSRLVSVGDSSNVRRSFDAVTLIFKAHDLKLEGFLSRPVQIRRGVFDNGWTEGSGFWGIYSTLEDIIPDSLNADVYYLGFHKDGASYPSGTEKELRHSIGTRVFSEMRSVDYNLEAVYQWGFFGGSGIQAWTAASDIGFTWHHLPLKPRLGLKFDLASGDGDLADQKLGTFNALFPKSTYFNYASLLGPSNMFDLHPSLTVEPTRGLSLLLDWDFVWRQSNADGIYDGRMNLLAGGNASQSKYVGSQLSLVTEFNYGLHWEFLGSYTHFFVGEFLQQAIQGKDVDYFTVWAAYRL